MISSVGNIDQQGSVPVPFGTSKLAKVKLKNYELGMSASLISLFLFPFTLLHPYSPI
jgi:hypothetical protein